MFGLAVASIDWVKVLDVLIKILQMISVEIAN